MSTVEQLEEKLKPFGQSHLLRFFNDLSDSEKKSLADQIELLDLQRAIDVFRRYSVLKDDSPSNVHPIDSCHYKAFRDCTKQQLDSYWNSGLEAIESGKVAVIVLAGGQATRLGADKPKGMLSLGLLRQDDSLLQIQYAQKCKLQQLSSNRNAAQARDRAQIHWIVMTSKGTKEPTAAYISDMIKKGPYPDEKVHFITQEEFPCFTADGKMILSEKCRIATSPDGNGGLYKALKSVVGEMRDLGVQFVHVYCVDNILCRVADPHFLGYCIQNGADCAAKVVEKRDPSESVGIVCSVDGVAKVIEYSEISRQMAQMKDSDRTDRLAFRAGNIANHFFTLSFLERISCPEKEAASSDSGKLRFELPYHPANKKIPYINEIGQLVKPDQPNGIKMEQFVFDVFQEARAFYVWEVQREEEFSPLKNAESAKTECLSTCSRDLWALHKRWLEAAGGSVNSTSSLPSVEVHPSISYAGENLESIVKGKTFDAPVYLE